MKRKFSQKIKLPIIKGKVNCFHKKAICPWCKKGKVLEPHSMAILAAGALLKDKKNKAWVPSDLMKGFLEFGWHGAHDIGTGENREIYLVSYIAQDVVGGQFDIYFCSTRCLREFLNFCVNELEKRIEQEK